MSQITDTTGPDVTRRILLRYLFPKI